MKHLLQLHCRWIGRPAFIRLLLFAQVLILASLTSLQAQTTRYVLQGGAGDGSGTDWDNASGDLQSMMDYSQPGDQVWVAAEILKPGYQRWHSFSLRPGVAVYGGFTGTETSLAERYLTRPTILSGDIGEPGDPTDNCYHVIGTVNATRSTILDGFVILYGYADGEDDDAIGAGMLNSGGCGNSSPTLRNCYFGYNQATSGAAFYSQGTGNHPLLINCVFFNNQLIGDGTGGAITVSGSELTMVNCSLVGNRAKQGNAIRNEGTLTMTNCILWNNKPNYDGEIQGDDGLDITGAGTTAVTFSINQDNLPGTGNQVSDPAFANEATGNLRLTACSFAINSGNLNSYTAVSGPDKDIVGENRAFGGYIDRGAFEFQGETDALFFINPAPQSFTVCATRINESPSKTKIVVGLGGKGPVNYAFYKDGVKYDEYETSGDASVFEYNTDMSSGEYHMVVSNSCGSITSEPFNLTVIPQLTVSIAASPAGPGSVTVVQNTSPVSLTASGCAGTLVWTGPGSPAGSTVSIPTSTTGTFAYSVYCQQGSCTSPTASFTVIVTPAPTATGSFDGFLYGADCSSFRGWAWDRNKPNTVFSVDIYDGATFKVTLAANEFRQDLKDAGKGNGIHAFRWTIPEALKDGQVHSLSARVSGSSFTLKEGPKTILCQTGTTPPPPNKQPVAPVIAALTAQQGVDFTTTLPVFTDPEGGTLSYGLAGLPSGLTFTSGSRQITGKPGAEGGFVLTYSATDPQGATNSVSFNLTVAGSTTIVTGDFEGYLDKVECGTIRGWVWDRKKPNIPLTVEFFTGPTVWGSVVANIYRDDLKNAGKGNGAHAYSFTVPNVLKDNTIHLISARVSGSSYTLKDSGKPLTCSSPAPTRLSTETGPGFQVTVLGNPVSNQLQVEVRGAEGQPLHLQLTDASGRILHEQQIREAKTVERPTIWVHNQPSGLLLLRATSGMHSVTVKVLKY